jgi:tape measure domain-containing protein
MATTATTTIKVVADTTQAQRALGDLQSTLGRLASVAAITALTTQFINLADASTNLQNKLRLVTQQGQTSTELFNLMAKTANNLGAPLSDVGDLFFRIANNTKDLSLAQTDQLRVTELMTKAFMTTGLSMNEAKNAVIQFGQGLSAGVLRGEELNSILENAPPIADAIAAHFGVARGALKALGEQGKITSKDVIDGMLAAGKSIDDAFATRIPTVANAFTTLQNSVQVAFSQFDKGTGASQAMSLALLKIANALVTVIQFFEKWGNIIVVVAEFFLIGKLFKVIKALITPLLGLVEAGTSFYNTLLAWGGALANVQGPFRKVITFFSMLVETYLPNAVSWFNALLSVVAGVASFLGVTALFDAVKGLFSKDATTAAEKYKKELDKLNKSLGIDHVEASQLATQASNATTTQQLSDADRIRKANIDRAQSWKEILKAQTDSLELTKYEGSALKVQEALNAANSKLIKEIKNDKGEIIGYTNGLNASESKVLENLVLQTLQRELQRDINKQLTDSTAALSLAQISVANLTSEQLDTELKVLEARQQYGKLLTPQLEQQVRTNEQNKIQLKLLQDLAGLNKTVSQSQAEFNFIKANATKMTSEQLDSELRILEAKQKYGALLTPELEQKLRIVELDKIQGKQIREIADISRAYTESQQQLDMVKKNIGSSSNEQLDTELKILVAQTKYGSLLTDEIKQKMRSTDETARQIDLMKSLNSAMRSQAPLGGIQAGIQAAGQLGSLDPVKAAQTANETLFNGLKYLRDQDLISEQTYQTARVNAAVQANATMMDAQAKMYEQRKLFELQSQQNSIFGYEQQKAIASESAKFEMQSQYEKTQFGIQQGAALFSSLGAQNKKAFEASKALNIANAIMNTYAGATKALATYPWPFGLIAAAAAVAAGMAQVSAIRSQQYSGRALGGPVMGNKPYIVGERGPELFTPNTTGSITPNNQLTGGGSTNVTFVIQAVDTAGFDELLSSRKGLITQIISDAQLERGRRA